MELGPWPDGCTTRGLCHRAERPLAASLNPRAEQGRAPPEAWPPDGCLFLLQTQLWGSQWVCRKLLPLLAQPRVAGWHFLFQAPGSLWNSKRPRESPLSPGAWVVQCSAEDGLCEPRGGRAGWGRNRAPDLSSGYFGIVWKCFRNYFGSFSNSVYLVLAIGGENVGHKMLKDTRAG